MTRAPALWISLSTIAVASAWAGAAAAEEGQVLVASAEKVAVNKKDDPKAIKTAKTAPKKDESKAWETAKPEHRGGFAIGIMASGGVGASNGYPADSKKIGRYAYYTESGLGFMGASGIWLGGALAEWLTFGLGAGYSMIINGETQSPAPFFFFHADVYPLYPLGGALRNLGVMSEFGLGFPTTTRTEDDELLIDGTGSSFVMAGVFWEGIEAWKVKMGPYLATHYMWSDSIRRPSALLGFRLSLYTKP